MSRATLKQFLRSLATARPSFGMTLTIELYSVYLHKIYSIVDVILKEGVDGLVKAKPSFCVPTTKILKPVFA